MSKTILSYLRAEGSSGQGQIIKNYKNYLEKYNTEKFFQKKENAAILFQYPIIILCDNDKGLKDVFKEIKECEEIKICLQGKSKQGEEYKSFLQCKKDFYHITENLYIIKLPEIEDKETCIEELYHTDDQEFSVEILAEKIRLTYKKTSGDYDYSKELFSQKITKEVKKIDFSGFSPLLDRVISCIQDYENRRLRQTLAPK